MIKEYFWWSAGWRRVFSDSLNDPGGNDPWALGDILMNWEKCNSFLWVWVYKDEKSEAGWSDRFFFSSVFMQLPIQLQASFRWTDQDQTNTDRHESFYPESFHEDIADKLKSAGHTTFLIDRLGHGGRFWNRSKWLHFILRYIVHLSLDKLIAGKNREGQLFIYGHLLTALK